MKIIKIGDIINESKRGELTTIVVKIGDKTFFNRDASNTFVQVVNYISDSVGPEKFLQENIKASSGRSFIGLTKEDLPKYVREGSLNKNTTGIFIISTHCSTNEKKNIIESLFDKYQIDGTVEIRNRSGNETKKVVSHSDKEENETGEGFENKGEYSDDELTNKLTKLLNDGIDDNGVNRLNNIMRKSIVVFLRILLSENKKFKREEIKSKLFENGIGKTVGNSGKILSNISQFITKRNSDLLRQIINYDLIRWTLSAENDIGAKKDNYSIDDRYRNLVSDVISNINDSDKLEEVKNVYCVRAGQSNIDVNIFVDNGFAGISYGMTSDISKMSREEISTALNSRESTKNQISQYLSQIEIFKQINIGDIILCPGSDLIHVGEVTSDIYFSEEHGYENKVNVNWIEEIEKNKIINQPKTVFKIKNFDTDTFEFTTNGDEVFDIVDDESEISKFSNFGIPKNFKGVQAQEELEEVESPYKQSICILGKSGRGKSTTIEMILDLMKVEYDFIIPTASTTALLSQYSSKAKGYIKSRLGKMIMDANQNKGKNYIAVFDECHKSNTIEMINDELLQCISTYRNNGKRFISVDDETADLFTGLKSNKGNLLIPDNLGFIFLSSKPDVITDNSDFFNRVDIFVMTKQPPKDFDLSSLINDDNKLVDSDYFVKVDGKSPEDIDTIKELNDDAK